MNSTFAGARCAGVDGCAAGWVVASSDSCIVVASLADVIERFDVIGIDIPIGLPASGARECDRAARRFLGSRRSTVFPAPQRALLDHRDYASANTASRRLFGRGLTRQTFNLFPKIREVDALARAASDLFVEIHPECAFARLAGAPIASKHQVSAQIERRELLAPMFGELPRRLPGARPDDLLDAYAVLWSALRYVSGEHVEFGDGTRDERGLPMRIVS